MDKREQIEGALMRGAITDCDCYGCRNERVGIAKVIDALAEQAIVENCTVKHIEACPFSEDRTTILIGEIAGHHGTPGKALCIIIPLEEDFEDFIMRETEAAIEGGIIDENTGLPFDLEEE